MDCIYCGKELTEDVVFCPKCGKKIGGREEEAPAQEEGSMLENEETQTTAQEQEETANIEAKKSNRKIPKKRRRILIVSAVCLIVLIAWGKPKLTKTTLLSAAEKDNIVLLKLLLPFSSKYTIDRALDIAVESNSADSIYILVKAGADATDVPLGSLWDPSIVEYLIKNGANVNSSNSLERAVNLRNFDVVRMLIDYGADVNEGFNLHSAVSAYGVTNLAVYLSIARLLLESGADVYAKDSRGKTPLMIAEEHGQVEMVDLLRRYMR